jgi:putative restriction endonuclease
MKQGQKLWTRDEILIAINLYHKLTFGQLDARNKLVIEVAEKLERTSNSLALKLVNLASLDESLPRKGMSNCSKLDKEVWNEFYLTPEKTVYESEILINKIIQEDIEFDFEEIKHKKTSVERTIISRVNQSFFRKSILASYENKCCISGLNINSMLIASHIIPWNIDEKNRLNPCNGLCLNSLYDKAFDKGYITINSDYKIIISQQIFNLEKTKYIEDTFLNLNKTKIELPKKFLPKKEFIEYHNDLIFLK